MDSKHNYKAEDLLSNQVPQGKEHLVSDSEKELAGSITSALKSAGNEKLSSLEVAELWAKIQDSNAVKPHSFNWKLSLKVAAVLVLISGLGLWQYQQQASTSKLMDFAAQNINKKIYQKSPAAEKQVDSSIAVNSNEDDIITTNDFNTLVVGDGQRSVLHLPDGTKVWLNSGSKLIYPVSFAKENREVYLEGEAYFDVAHNQDKPFIVRAKNMNIKVLGTEFYMSSDTVDDKNYAVLVSGSIKFSSGGWLNKVERTIVPGEKIDYSPDEHKLEVSQVKTTDVRSWKEGYLDIESQPLDVLIQRIAAYYNISISTSNLDLSREKFTGKLVFQRSAQDVIDLLCNGTPYSYDSEERRIEIRKP